MSFIGLRMKNHFDIKGWSLVLIQRPGGTRKWPIRHVLSEWKTGYDHEASWDHLWPDIMKVNQHGALQVLFQTTITDSEMQLIPKDPNAPDMYSTVNITWRGTLNRWVGAVRHIYIYIYIFFFFFFFFFEVLSNDSNSLCGHKSYQFPTRLKHGQLLESSITEERVIFFHLCSDSRVVHHLTL